MKKLLLLISLFFPLSLCASISITQPTDQQTFVNNTQGDVKVIVDIQPALHTGEQIQLLLDNQSMGTTQTTTEFNLNNIDRGQHTVQAEIINAANKVIASSDTITFFMQRPRIKHK